jgi:RNA polymerase sigma-70 factor (family 1)
MNDYKNYSEIELVRLLKANDHNAYKEIYNRYFRLVFFHGIRRLDNKEQVTDFVQDAFIKLWEKREVILPETIVVAYLFTLVKNRILDHFGHQQVKAKYVSSIKTYISKYSGPRTDYLVRERDMEAQINKEIQALPKKMRAVFVLSRKAHFSYQEIAAELNTTENNVSKQVNSALRILKMKLGIT